MEKNRNENNRKNPLNKSFGYAFEGIRTGIRKERNMKIHCLAVIAVTVAGTFLHIKPVEWCICLLLFGLILSLELVNTALEAVVDLVTKEKKPLAKIAKDTAAGAVLVSAIAAAIFRISAALAPLSRWGIAAKAASLSSFISRA